MTSTEPASSSGAVPLAGRDSHAPARPDGPPDEVRPPGTAVRLTEDVGGGTAPATAPAGVAVSFASPRGAAGRVARGRPPWGVADMLLAVVLGLALAVALGVVVFVQARLLSLELSPTAWFGLLGTGTYAALGLTTWAFALQRHGAPWTALGFCRVRARSLLLMVPAALGLLFANLVVILPLTALLLGGEAAGEGQDPYEGLNFGGLDLLWIAVPVVVAAPVVEEVLFRGLLYRYLRGRLRGGIGLGGAVAVSATVFAVLHIVIPPILVMGIALALVAERYDSLYPGMVLHAVNNGLVIALLALAVALG